MKLIDADEVLKIVKHFGLSNPALIGRHSGIADIIYDRIEGLLPIETEFVKHGEWVYDYDRDCIKCSLCGEYDALSRDDYSYRGGKIRDNHSAFCPNCGAKMDLEESE